MFWGLHWFVSATYQQLTGARRQPVGAAYHKGYFLPTRFNLQVGVRMLRLFSSFWPCVQVAVCLVAGPGRWQRQEQLVQMPLISTSLLSEIVTLTVFLGQHSGPGGTAGVAVACASDPCMRWSTADQQQRQWVCSSAKQLVQPLACCGALLT